MISAAALYPRIPPTSIVPKCTTFCSLSHSPSRISVRSQTLQSSASTRSLFRRLCFEKNRADELFDRFSALPSDIPWHDGDIWSIFAAYFFILHIPLSFGGLSVVAEVLHEPDLDPLIMIIPCGSSSSLIAKNMQPFKKLYARIEKDSGYGNKGRERVEEAQELQCKTIGWVKLSKHSAVSGHMNSD